MEAQQHLPILSAIANSDPATDRSICEPTPYTLHHIPFLLEILVSLPTLLADSENIPLEA